MRELIGREYGAIRRYAETIEEPRTRLMNYLTDQRVPPIRVLEKMADKDGVDLHWLITGKGAKYVEKEGFRTLRRVPILGKVPAGPSGGEQISTSVHSNILFVEGTEMPSYSGQSDDLLKQVRRGCCCDSMNTKYTGMIHGPFPPNSRY